MKMTEALMIRSVQLDKDAVGPLDVCIVKSGNTRQIADIGKRCKELRAEVELGLVHGLHVPRAPTEVPDRRSGFPRRRSSHLFKKQPRFVRPDGFLDARVTRLLGVEMPRVKGCGLRRRCRIQVNVVEMGHRSTTIGRLRESRRGPQPKHTMAEFSGGHEEPDYT